MRVELHSCFILHQKPYRETSLLLEVFSENFGRVGLVAKGANRKRGSFRQLCQPFSPVQIAWSGRGELGNLISVEPDNHHSYTGHQLLGDKLFSGFYLNELLIRLLHRHDPHSELFSIYAHTLTALNETSCLESVLRIFEKRLLEQLGYGLMLEHDVASGAVIESDKDYEYLLDNGPRLLSSGEVNAGGIRVSGQTLQILMDETHFTNNMCRKEAKKLMRYALKPHLGDKPLHSRHIFESMKT